MIMSVLSIAGLKKLLRITHGSNQEDMVDTLTTIKRIKKITDGAQVVVNAENYNQAKGILKTALTTLTVNISNMGDIVNLIVLPSGGDATVTITGSGLKFIDMDNVASAAVTVDIVCTDVVYNEISLNDSGDKSGKDRVILLVKK